MHSNRRDFIKQAALLAGGAAITGAVPDSIRKAMAIEPASGSTYLDAEHIVILMQENRSFDHMFGSLRGVRGFSDPRAITLPDGQPVWAQPGTQGERCVPFRLNIKETKATWMGSLPHSWTDQVDARNNGRYDRWLAVKHSGEKQFSHMPLTLGYYTREDIPFYYALADAFTVCDQHFCSTLTGTTPNRLHLWSGTVRPTQSPDAIANVLNSDVNYGRWASWTTFPERLQAAGISWRVYQNELSLESGFDGDQDAWLANFTDNPLEWFTQYGVRFAASHRKFAARRLAELPAQIQSHRDKLAAASGEARRKLEKRLTELESDLARLTAESQDFSASRFDALTPSQKDLHQRAFSTNAADPNYRELEQHTYRDGDQSRSVLIPKGDVLFQFRKDVAEGKLPTVSWLVPPERYSDHPGSAWYGAWYLSEVLDILTRNPDVWKKTIFILTYDENDGYFDHVPPYVAPNPKDPTSGKVSPGIDPGLEYVDMARDKQWHHDGARESPIGLGYRVPMIIASPWSRGGCVCSQVFDHTSVLQFLERVLSHRSGTQIRETNINAWRRTVCGDLTSAFAAADDVKPALVPLDREAVVEQIHKAQFKGLPSGFAPLSPSQLASLSSPDRGSLLPRQEPGTRRSCPLPYELDVSGGLDNGRANIALRLSARNNRFAARAAGCPFTAYVMVGQTDFTCRNYAVSAGATLEDTFPLSAFPMEAYRVHVHGPNGFLRELAGSQSDPKLHVDTPAYDKDHASQDPELVLRIVNSDPTSEHVVTLQANAYSTATQTARVPAGATVLVRVPLSSSSGWYDLTARVAGADTFARRFAGRVETGNWSVSDPAMAGTA